MTHTDWPKDYEGNTDEPLEKILAEHAKWKGQKKQWSDWAAAYMAAILVVSLMLAPAVFWVGTAHLIDGISGHIQALAFTFGAPLMAVIILIARLIHKDISKMKD